MDKKYIVRLNDAEREQLNLIVKKFSGSSQKVRRAQILMKSDANGPAWTDKQIADAFGCRTKTVENIRQRLVESGFSQTLEGKMRSEPARPNVSLATKKLGSSPRVWANHQLVTPTGRSDCLLIRW
jgi:hypothetical protein